MKIPRKIFMIVSATLILALVTVNIVLAANPSVKEVDYEDMTLVLTNTIIDGNPNPNWNAQINISTSPSTSMETIGATVWTTYQLCGGIIDYYTFLQYDSRDYSWMIQHYTHSFYNGVARSKAPCDSTTTGYDYANYYYRLNTGTPYGGSDNTATATMVSVW